MKKQLRGRRLLAVVLGTIVLGAALAPSAMAQYEETTTTTRRTTTTTRPTTTTTRATTTTTRPGSAITSTTAPATTVVIRDDDQETPAEDPSVQAATVGQTEIRPGESTSVSTQFFDEASGDAIPAGTTVSIEVSSVSDSQPVFLATAQVDENGQVTIDVAVPEGSAPGVYLVIIILPAQTDADGNITRRPIVAIAALVVRGTVSAQGVSGGAASSGGPLAGDPAARAFVDSARTPAVVAAIAAIAEPVQVAGEENVVDAVADGAELAFDGAALTLDGLPLTGGDESDSGRAINAAVALGIAGAGLLLIRRRNAQGAVR